MLAWRLGCVLALAFVVACGQTTSDRVAGTELGGSDAGPAGGTGGGPAGGTGGGPAGGGGTGGALPAGGTGGGVVPSCEDGIRNGGEIDIDCGGPDCAPCIDPNLPCGCDTGAGISVELGGQHFEMNAAFPELLDHGPGYFAGNGECTPAHAHAVVGYCASFPKSVAGCTDSGPQAACIQFYPGPVEDPRSGTFRDLAGREWLLLHGEFDWDTTRLLYGGHWLLGGFRFQVADGRELTGTVNICTVGEIGCLE